MASWVEQEFVQSVHEYRASTAWNIIQCRLSQQCGTDGLGLDQQLHGCSPADDGEVGQRGHGVTELVMRSDLVEARYWSRVVSPSSHSSCLALASKKALHRLNPLHWVATLCGGDLIFVSTEALGTRKPCKTVTFFCAKNDNFAWVATMTLVRNLTAQRRKIILSRKTLKTAIL